MTFKFKDNQTVEDITTVDENLRPLYVQGEDGKYTVRAEFQVTASAWDGLATANGRIRKDNKDLQAANVDLSPLSSFGTNVNEILESFTAQKQELSDALDKNKDAPNPDKIKKQLSEAFSEEKKVFQAKNEALQSQLYSTLITKEVMSALTAEKGDVKLLQPFMLSQIQMREENGKQVARVMDGDGDVRYGPTGSEMTVRELAANMRKDKDYAKLFESEQKQGGGPPANRLPTAGPNSTAKRSPTDKIKAGLATRD